MAAKISKEKGNQIVMGKDLKVREFSVSIGKDGKGFFVRKTEHIGKIKVPLFETYVLGIEDAIKVQNQLINEIHNNQLN